MREELKTTLSPGTVLCPMEKVRPVGEGRYVGRKHLSCPRCHRAVPSSDGYRQYETYRCIHCDENFTFVGYMEAEDNGFYKAVLTLPQ
jgi:hypothetical protein